MSDLASKLVGAPGPLVLIVEDEQPIRRFLRVTLESEGYRVKESSGAKDGLMQASEQRPDVILLDLGLPDGDGLQVTKQIRAWSSVPIIVISARGQESDKVAALDSGADDYLTKPFGVAELLARLRVALRHASGADAVQRYEAAADGRTILIDLAARVVKLSGPGPEREARLTPTEFKLLAYFVKHAGKVVTHRQILTEVWGPTHAADVQYLRVYTGELRKKLETDPAQPRFLITEPGVGYRFVEPNAKPQHRHIS